MLPSLFNSSSYSPHSKLLSPALYHEPTFRDFGLRWIGQRGFGGILKDWSESSNESTRWIPQYNLNNFWKRLIPPLPVGLIEPLIPSRISKGNDFDRFPGEFSFKSQDAQFYNRNLLAARHYDWKEGDSMKIKIWTVDERSKRHYLECYSFDMDHKGHPVVDSKLHLLHRKMKMVPPVKLYPEAGRLPREPILEIRTSVWSDSDSTTLFLRSPTLLRILRQDEVDSTYKHDLVPIFNKAVKYFAESDLIDDQLVVVDHGGRVWIHDFTSQTSLKARKIKANEDDIYQRGIFCDNPRMLAIAGNWHVETVDARCSGSSGACTRLWDSPQFACRCPDEPLEVQPKPIVSAIVHHLERVPGTANMYVIMTDHALHLIDDRFPGNTVVQVRHPFSHGTHKIIVSQGIKDEVGGGMVHSIYCLDQLHYMRMGVSIIKLYLHPSGVWSAVDSFRSLGEPEDYNIATRYGKHANDGEMPTEPTRGICLLEGVGRRRKQTMLLRQQDSGAIWCQWMSHETLSEKRISKYETASGRTIRDTKHSDEQWERPSWKPVFAKTVEKKFKLSPKNNRTNHSLEAMGFSSIVIKKSSHISLRLLLRTNEIRKKTYNPGILEVLQLDDEKSVISKIVMDTYKKVDVKLRSTVSGFRGSHSCEHSKYDEANLAQTYSALLSLAILGDDLRRVDREAILKSVKAAQRDNGCFWSQGVGSESDMRFVFCAVAICKILDGDKDGTVDWETLGTFLKKSINIDGGIGQAPNDESHGGSTFCAIAALALSNRLWTGEVLNQKQIKRLIRWTVQKQDVGFHGRAHKPDDSCYAFWIGATLKILNAYHLIHPTYLREFLMISQHPHIGGFCKYPEPGGFSDLLHTYFSIAALSLLGEPAINPVNPALNVSMRVSEHIAKIRFT